MKNDWISITEDMPQKDPRYGNLSVEVEVMLKDMAITEAFYAADGTWYTAKRCDEIPKNNGVVKWRSKP